jgi:uncharacterized protein YggU (UPF0235/DUF167 family)
MKLTIKVKTKSKFPSIVLESDGSYTISVREMPIKGEANSAVISALSKELKIPKSKIEIASGEKSKNKIVNILD